MGELLREVGVLAVLLDATIQVSTAAVVVGSAGVLAGVAGIVSARRGGR